MKEALYNHAIRGIEIGVLSREQVQDTAALQSPVGSYVQSVVRDLPKGAASDTKDFFAFGLDSVQIIELAKWSARSAPPTSQPQRLVASTSKDDTCKFDDSKPFGIPRQPFGNEDRRCRNDARSSYERNSKKYTSGLPEAANGVYQASGVSKAKSNANTNGAPPSTGISHTNGGSH